MVRFIFSIFTSLKRGFLMFMENIENIFRQKKGKLMVIHPHPDDETFMTGGILVTAKKYGWETFVLILTKGGAGKLHTNPRGLSVKEIRSMEVKKAVNILNVDKLVLKDFSDSKLKLEADKWRSFLVNQIKKEKPQIVVTYDHSGISGHPDHIVTSVEVLKIIKSLKIKKMQLYWATAPKMFVKKFLNERLLDFVSKPTHILKLNACVILRKFKAIKSHKSQNLLPIMQLLTEFKFLRLEWYHKVNLKKDYNYKYINFRI